MPASIAFIAISAAAGAVFAWTAVTNSTCFLRPVTTMGAPSTRQILARHFPGSDSNAWMTNCIYSTSDLRRNIDSAGTSDKTQRLSESLLSDAVFYEEAPARGQVLIARIDSLEWIHRWRRSPRSANQAPRTMPRRYGRPHEWPCRCP